MSRLIIYVSGKPLLHGHKRREFLWSPTHRCYLYNGKEIDASEFNATYDKAMRNNSDMSPRVMVVPSMEVQSEPPTSSSTSAVVEKVTVTEPDEPNVAGVTVDEAVAVLERLAPERLKKKTGPKPKILEVA